MRFLIMTQIYAPEMGAPTTRLQSLAQGLIRAGHEVTVATGMPNYPAGRVHDGYRGRLSMKESIDGVQVVRHVYYTTPRNIGKVKQLLSYLSFLPAVFLSGLRSGPIDCIIVSSPPIFPVLPAILLRWIKKSKLVYDVRDLWPDEIVACGGARDESLPIKLIRQIEKLIYRKADRIACTTKTFMRLVGERGGTAERQMYVPNGADTNLFRPMDVGPLWKEEHQLTGKVVILYSGVIGLKHGLRVVVDAAERLRHRSDIAFVFVGDGAARAELEELAVGRGLTNVRFLGPHENSSIPAIINAADICVTSLTASPYLKSILAVKIFEYLACGRPVIAAVDGESRTVIQESRGGLVVAPEDDAAMADAVIKLTDDPKLRSQLAEAGPKFVRQNFCRVNIAGQFAETLAEFLRESGVR